MRLIFVCPRQKKKAKLSKHTAVENENLDRTIALLSHRRFIFAAGVVRDRQKLSPFVARSSCFSHFSWLKKSNAACMSELAFKAVCCQWRYQPGSILPVTTTKIAK
tara:strand:- start:109928 stop:110245 length:318 start_codon:yes stop_codon:yes gene_type:complete